MAGLIGYLHTHPHTAYLVAFAVAFAESLPIIGTIIPGSVTMTAIGALIGGGILPATPTLICATLGAFVGDFFSYWVGARYNQRLRSIWPLNKNPRWLTLGEDFFRKHGGKSVVFGRFFGPIRSAVPLIAGMMHMRTGRFIMAALPSATIWVVIYILPGILVGALSLELPPAAATKFILLTLCAVAFGWLIFVGMHICFKRALQLIDRLIEKAWTAWFQSSRMTVITDFFNHPYQTHPHQQLTRMIAIFLCGLIFIWLWISVYSQGVLTWGNTPVYSLFRYLRHLPLDNVAIAITFLGDKKILLPAALLVGLWLIWRRNIRIGYIWLSTVVLGAGAGYLAKYVYFSPRPQGILNVALDSSFPSGHASLSMIFYGFLAFLIASAVTPSRRGFIYSIAGIVIGLVSLSRLYLGAHWLTDVLAGIFLGLIFVLLGVLFYVRRPMRSAQPGALAGISLSAVLVVGSIYGVTHFRMAQHDYTLYWPNITIDQDSWWESNIRNEEIPLFTTSGLGHLKEVLNVQWAGGLDDITTAMLKGGWVNHAIDFRLSSVLHRLSVSSHSAHLPILPVRYHNETPVRLFTRLDDQGQQITLILWRSFATLENNPTTAKAFWLGSLYAYVSHENRIKLPAQKVRALYDSAAKNFLKSLSSSFMFKVIHVSYEDQPLVVQKVDWDGKLLLIRPNSD
jgi:membrane protein DedA with SNARE-associated domain/membrane-associated phospholipid phosphatase